MLSGVQFLSQKKATKLPVSGVAVGVFTESQLESSPKEKCRETS
jgi:hypothetical protein